MTSTTTSLPAANLVAHNLTAADRYLASRIKELRVEYAKLSSSIVTTIAVGSPRHGKPKLCLAMPDLARHMQEREERVKSQHLLLLLVPVHRLVRAATQQRIAIGSKPSRQLAAVSQMLFLRCAGALPHAKNEVTHLFAQFPALFGPFAPGVKTVDPNKKVQAEKATALHTKLLASGILDSDEVVTLRKVFERYIS